tara:strand:+ start:292 stop:978 length:687 start_codon:yes stop_codon:yes gene_type:complete
MKISIFGAGNVGAACGFASLFELKPEELVIVDINDALASGEALDLAHAAVVISPQTKVVGGDAVPAIKDSDFIIITAGKARTPDIKSRDDLFEINKRIIEAICKGVNEFAPEATILMVTNPSTKLADVAKSVCSGPIVAMDNQLDTARLKYYLSTTGLKVEDIKSEITGEHGENMQFKIRDAVDEETVEKVKKLVRETGSNLISLKGFTNWGVASQVVSEIKRIAATH